MLEGSQGRKTNLQAGGKTGTTSALLAGKGYDADAIREELARAGVEAIIPAKSNRQTPIPHDCEKYRWRNLVERLFSKHKNWGCVATRYDKTGESYLGFVALALVAPWLAFIHVN